MFIIAKGEFEQQKRLPHPISTFKIQQEVLNVRLPTSEEERMNILARRLPEIKDVPFQMKVVIACTGSILGEEDCVSRQKYTSSVRCISQKGTMYELPAEAFLNIQNQERSWLMVIEKVVQKEHRLMATHLTNKIPK